MMWINFRVEEKKIKMNEKWWEGLLAKMTKDGKEELSKWLL